MPGWGSNRGQCLLGSALGARFQPDFLRGAPRLVGATVTSAFGALVAAAGFGYLQAQAAGLHLQP